MALLEDLPNLNLRNCTNAKFLQAFLFSLYTEMGLMDSSWQQKNLVGLHLHPVALPCVLELALNLGHFRPLLLAGRPQRVRDGRNLLLPRLVALPLRGQQLQTFPAFPLQGLR